jgi:hypothetical protein
MLSAVYIVYLDAQGTPSVPEVEKQIPQKGGVPVRLVVWLKKRE